MIRIFLASIIALLVTIAGCNNYERGQAEYDKGNFVEAANSWKPLAESGDMKAQYQLANLYLKALGVPINKNTGLFWLTKAADAGHTKAMTQLATIKNNGDGTPQDFSGAFNLASKSAAIGDIEAQTILASLYVDGHGTPIDLKKAAYWYSKAAESGIAMNQYRIAAFHYSHDGAIDYEQALKWALLAANQNNGDAFNLLGSMYVYGKGVTQDLEAASEWFRKAIKHGKPSTIQVATENLKQTLAAIEKQKEENDPKTGYILDGIKYFAYLRTPSGNRLMPPYYVLLSHQTCPAPDAPKGWRIGYFSYVNESESVAACWIEDDNRIIKICPKGGYTSRYESIDNNGYARAVECEGYPANSFLDATHLPRSANFQH